MVLKEFIENIQEKKLKKAALTASAEKRAKISKQIFIIKQNKARRDAIDKARAKARFESQLRAAKERPSFDEEQRQAAQRFKVKTIRSRGTLPSQPKKGALAGFDKFLAGTGVAKGTTPVLGGKGRAATGVDVIGGKKRKGGFNVI